MDDRELAGVVFERDDLQRHTMRIRPQEHHKAGLTKLPQRERA